MSRVEVDVIAPDPVRPAVLVEDTANGPRLPRLGFPGAWAPSDRRLTEELARRTGLRATLLEPLGYTAFVVEPRDPAAAPPRGLRWAQGAELERVGEPADLVRSWLARRAAGADATKPAWLRPGWYERATRWTDGALAGLGARRTGAPAQEKLWSMSCVLRVDTDRDAYYLKSVLPHLALEPDVIAYLAARWPGSLPDIADRSRADDWWLSPDFGGVPAQDLPAPERKGCLSTLAGMQRALVDRTQDLTGLGCPTWGPADLARRVPELLGRRDVWGTPDHPLGGFRTLDADETRRWLALGGWLQDRCAALDALGIPLSLVHGDFHGGNAVRTASGQFLLYDWSFASVSHPFFDLASWLHGATDEEAAAAVEEYLQCWGDVFGPDELTAAWRTAKPVSALMEILKFLDLWDTVGPDYGFNWSPMVYGWARRLMRAAADPEAERAAWHK